jgi:hypothetical protein
MSHRRTRLALSCLLAAGAASLTACRSEEPVATVSAQQRQLRFPHGSLVPLELRWQATHPLPQAATPLVFVHLLDAQGAVVRTFDHQFPARWQPGVTTPDRIALYHSAIGPALPPGDYRLTMGLYDGKDKRFPLRIEGGEEVRRKEYVVAQVTVPEVAANAPALAFSPEWGEAEPSGDRQAVARRWLAGDGAVEVSRVTPPARLWMLLRIPVAEPPLRLLLDEGATMPSVKVASSCGVGFSADVAGEGFHELAVPIATADPCRVTFDTNYTVVEMGSGRKLSVGLEQMGWEAGSATGP